jgi:hypothetical protein
MKSITLAALLAALAFSPAHGANDPKSVALVRAMRTDEISAATLKFAFLNGEMQKSFGATKPGCVRRVTYTEFTAPWAAVVESVLSPTEIDESLAFYQSDAGVKFIDGMLRRMREHQGKDSVLPEIAGHEAIDETQKAEISRFLSSDLGRKVTGKELITSPAAIEVGSVMGKKIAQMCGK